MSLEGSLKEFGLADILQLLYLQRKTGVLTLEGRMDRVRLMFYEGNIISAETRRKVEANRFGKLLLKNGAYQRGRSSESPGGTAVNRRKTWQHPHKKRRYWKRTYTGDSNNTDNRDSDSTLQLERW